MERISREETYILISKTIAQRGTCQRAKVGCVITRENRIVSTGYNGSLNHHCEECDITHKCKDAIHAEANAITFAAKEGISLKDSKLYCTHAPCYECAKLIIQAGITEVWFDDLYTDPSGLNLLKINGVTVCQVN